MKRSRQVVLTLFGLSALAMTLQACHEDRKDLAQCTDEADSDVDCVPPDGGHSDAFIQQRGYVGEWGDDYSHEHNHSATSGNAWLWYWIGRNSAGYYPPTAGGYSYYVRPPALNYAASPRTNTVSSFTSRGGTITSSRGGFSGTASAHAESVGG